MRRDPWSQTGTTTANAQTTASGSEDGTVTDTDLDGLLDNLPPNRSRRNRRTQWGLFSTAAVAVLLGVSALLWALHAGDQADNADSHAAAASSAAVANQAGLSKANDRIESLGGTPVPTPTQIPGSVGQRGPGPTDTEIADAVTLYCDRHSGCVGTPSQAQVLAAVTAFCAADACRGAKGSSGSPGASGASGDPGHAGVSGQPGQTGDQGQSGPGPTDDQIASAVAVYCSGHNDCTGPAGPKGDTGATGVTGRGIASVDCTGLGVDQLVIHYDDGTDQTVPCAVPTPTDTPSGAPTS